MINGFEMLPTDPPRPAPALMTAQEAVLFLRLSEGGRDIADAIKSLEYLVLTGRIRPCRVGRFNRYARVELERFITAQTIQSAIQQESRCTPSRIRRTQRDDPILPQGSL